MPAKIHRPVPRSKDRNRTSPLPLKSKKNLSKRKRLVVFVPIFSGIEYFCMIKSLRRLSGFRSYRSNQKIARMVCTIVLAACLFGAGGCSPKPSVESQATHSQLPTDMNSIVRFCADCHDLPNSSSFAKDRWREEVEQGIRIYKGSGRTDLEIPDVEATVALFQENAPEKLVILPPQRSDDVRFVAKPIPWPNARKPVSISSIKLLHKNGERPRFLLTDMWTGALSLATATQEGFGVTELGDVAHPAHIEPIDLDQDGKLDYVVADLGTLNPQVEKQGSVWWLRGQSEEPLKRQALKLGLSRVADVQAIDYDNDGDWDLIVGDFGLHYVGSIYLGTNEKTKDGAPQFIWTVIDPRPGTISLPTVDFDNDGRTDFFALIAQQYETVELKLNLGEGRFETKVVYTAGNPSDGSSGIELIDFDNDGDLDLLYTNGDTFDDTLAKPYHGIKWLENKGVFPFTVHHVAAMPGCYRAVAGDIDGDGDKDIAAVSYLSAEEVAKYAVDTFDAVAWFEQQSDGSFDRHSMQKNLCQAATCALTDWDLDGDLDLIVPPSATDHQPKSGLTVFMNEGSVSQDGASQ